jgi:hypothetical protein
MTGNKNIHYQDWLNKFILAGYSFIPFGLFFYQKILPPVLILQQKTTTPLQNV